MAPRHSFIAHAEILDEQRTTRLQARVSDLSLTGCYLDMLHPLPEGTTVFVKVTADSGSFQTKGRIVYAVPQLGAGVAFLEPSPELTTQLERSLAGASQ
jgi:PilZ domain